MQSYKDLTVYQKSKYLTIIEDMSFKEMYFLQEEVSKIVSKHIISLRRD